MPTIKKAALLLIMYLLFQPQAQAGPSKRYISLAPSTTEILFALGLGEEIVGVSSYCDYPPAVGSKERVGTFSRPDIEKILSLRPDYIFCTGLEQAPAIMELKQLNLTVYMADPSSLRQLYDSITEIGKITGRVNQAQALIKNMKGRIGEISSFVSLIPREKRQKVFIEIWHNPLFTVGKGSFVDELIVLAGGINIASGAKRPYSIYSPEEVIKRNPDCIILTYMSEKKPVDLVKKRIGWDKIKAVKNNRIYNDVDPNILLRPSPRVAEGVWEIYKRLYQQ